MPRNRNPHPDAPKRRVLSAAQTIQLGDYFRQHYVESGLDDEAFARKASEVLSFSIAGSSIVTMRTAFDVPPNKPRMLRAIEVPAAEFEELTGRLSAAETVIKEQVATIEQLTERVARLERFEFISYNAAPAAASARAN